MIFIEIGEHMEESDDICDIIGASDRIIPAAVA
jgi:hypothetical protein